MSSPVATFDLTINCPIAVYTIQQNGSGSNFTTSALACSSSTGGPALYMDTAALQLNSTHLYSDSMLTTPVATGGYWINVTDTNGIRRSVQTDTTGLVTAIVTC